MDLFVQPKPYYSCVFDGNSHLHDSNIIEPFFSHIQGVPNENCQKSIAVELKWCISKAILVKPKCVWEAENFLKRSKQTTEYWKISDTCQTHFGFTNIGSKMHWFSSTAIYFWQFSIGTPCTSIKADIKCSLWLGTNG